jgi:hypothetical protein
MRMSFHVAGLVAVIAACVALSGCVQSTPRVIPTAPETVKPVFASDADALAAAEKAYVKYLAVSDAVGDDGGKNPERITPLVAPDWLPTELKSYATFEKSGNTFSGSTSFTSFRLQRDEQTSDSLADVTVYVCLDLTKTRELNSVGTDITPRSRVDVYPIVAEFLSSQLAPTTLLFAGNEPWSGKNFC